MKYYLFVLGCQMNISDAERVTSVLENLGYKRTEKETNADLIVVLACSVRQSAIDRIFGRTRKWQNLKKSPLLVLSGCVLPADRPKMEKIFDFIFEMKNLKKLKKFLQGSVPCKLQGTDPGGDYFSIRPKYQSKFQAYIPIMTGCDNFCAYCAVPYTKGREKSRPEKEILTEVRSLVSKGYKEITLLGQNVNSYASRISADKTRISADRNDFVKLLEKINAIPGKFWIRFISSNPQDMSDELIMAVNNLEKVTEYIHLPVQAGNNEILRKMNRKYTREHYLRLVKKIRREIPEASITTDTIVGFPGETKKQFKDTIDLYKKVGFDMVYIAQYSPRPGTVAAKMKDDVPKQEKRRREKKLTNILKKTAIENNKKYIGRIVEVLVEKYQKGYLFGRTRTFKLVQILGEKSLIGNFIKVKIISVTPWAMRGEIIN